MATHRLLFSSKEKRSRGKTGWLFKISLRLVAAVLFLAIPSVSGERYGKNDVIDCDAIYSINQAVNGSIQTLGYPNPYPERRRCKVELHGDPHHRVILHFEDFYLFHPFGQHHQKHGRCNGLDMLSIYDGLEDGAKLIGEYCGGRQPLPLMSSGPYMALKLTSHTSGVGARGYSAKYYFVKNFGINSGKQIKEGVCEFEYDSTKKKEGNITSPNPGVHSQVRVDGNRETTSLHNLLLDNRKKGIYPTNTNCSYIFEGTFLERVFLKFHFFDLEGIEPCTVRSGSDFLEFSNLPGYDPFPARRCGRFSPQEVISDGPYFRINFRSNDRLNGLGFAASYKFVTDEQLPEWANYLKSNDAQPFVNVLAHQWLLLSSLCLALWNLALNPTI